MSNKSDEYMSVLSSTQFQRLLSIRNTIRYFLTFMIIMLHGLFVGGIAFYNEWFSETISEQSSIPIGVIVAVVVIISMIILEAIYILISKKIFDPLQQQLLSQVSHHE